MRGPSAFYVELVPLLFPFIFVGIGLYIAIRRTDLKGHQFGYVVVAFAMLFWLAFALRYSQQVRHHVILGSLDVATVSQIHVGDTDMTDAEQLGPVVAALRDKEWFTSDKGRWADMVPLVVTFDDGRTVSFRVGRHLKHDGAVVEFSRAGRGSRIHYGYAFCPQLPATLDELGVSLPTERTSAAEKHARDRQD